MAINFLFITAKAERKVRLGAKLFDFFSWANTNPFDLKFVTFCPKFSGDSFVDFQEKNYFGRIFHKFCANQGYPLPKLVKFRPTFCNFILGPYCAEKIHTSTFICCLHPGKEARPQTNHRKKIRGRKARTLTSFVHSRSGTYHALLLGYFGLKFLPDVRHCVCRVLAEI